MWHNYRLVMGVATSCVGQSRGCNEVNNIGRFFDGAVVASKVVSIGRRGGEEGISLQVSSALRLKTPKVLPTNHNMFRPIHRPDNQGKTHKFQKLTKITKMANI